jgi:hypothetical protein
MEPHDLGHDPAVVVVKPYGLGLDRVAFEMRSHGFEPDPAVIVDEPHGLGLNLAPTAGFDPDLSPSRLTASA